MEGCGRRGADGPTRRSLLAGAAAAAASAGCLERARSVVDHDYRSPVSISVKTVPAESDPAATAIGRHLVAHLEAVGVDATLVPMAERELLKDFLVDHDFDLYVASRARPADPDALRPLVHSRFSVESGWQNPFGYANLDVDRLLDDQRTTGGRDRRAAVDSLLGELARTQPLTPVVIADDVRAYRTDRVTVGDAGLDGPLGYLSLGLVEEDEDRTVTVTRADPRVTENLNPLSVAFRGRGTFTGLLYDPLARRVGGTILPWLADKWEWSDDGDGTALAVRLRRHVTWHDGRPLSAEDVAFTFRFLADTTLGEGEPPVPAPRFRGRSSLVDAVEAVDDRTCRLEFGTVDREVATRALTVPVLPEHVWRDRSGPAEVPGLDIHGGTTEALATANADPVGSGPLRVVDRVDGERLVLGRVDDHFAVSGPEAGGAAAGRSATRRAMVPFRRLVVEAVPSATAALELLASGRADLASVPLPASLVPRATRASDVGLTAVRDRTAYHVGFNVRRSPLGNPRFRRAVARLLDKASIADRTFNGFATPATTPLAGTDWVPPTLRWDGADPEVPFLGANGELDVAAARDAFRKSGFEYRDGDLVAG